MKLAIFGRKLIIIFHCIFVLFFSLSLVYHLIWNKLCRCCWFYANYSYLKSHRNGNGNIWWRLMRAVLCIGICNWGDTQTHCAGSGPIFQRWMEYVWLYCDRARCHWNVFRRCSRFICASCFSTGKWNRNTLLLGFHTFNVRITNLFVSENIIREKKKTIRSHWFLSPSNGSYNTHSNSFYESVSIHCRVASHRT